MLPSSWQNYFHAKTCANIKCFKTLPRHICDHKTKVGLLVAAHNFKQCCQPAALQTLRRQAQLFYILYHYYYCCDFRTKERRPMAVLVQHKYHIVRLSSDAGDHQQQGMAGINQGFPLEKPGPGCDWRWWAVVVCSLMLPAYIDSSA